LFALLETIDLFIRLEPTEWGPYQALERLAFTPKWDWVDRDHANLYLELVQRTRLALSSGKVIDLPDQILAVTRTYPEGQGDLEHYFKIIIAHKLLEPHAREKYTELVKLTFSNTWDWSDLLH
jgi:hypothetical protein